MTTFPQGEKKSTKSQTKPNVKYSKIDSPILNGKSCSSLTKITIDPVTDENVNLHIHTNTNVVLKPNYWNRLLPYIHIILLYVLVTFLYLDLRAMKQTMHNFHLSILNVSIRNMEFEVACSEELLALRRAVEGAKTPRSKRSIVSGEEEKIETPVVPDSMKYLLPILPERNFTAIEGYSDVQGMLDLIKRNVRSPERNKKGRGKQAPKRQNNRRNRRKVVFSAFLKGAQPDILVNDDVSTGLIAPWFIEPQSVGGFDLSSKIEMVEGKGVVKIKESGLYFIYAQVYYMTSNKMNSFTVSVMGDTQERSGGEKELSTCSVWGPGNVTGEVSCFTAVVKPLVRGDRLFLKQRERNRRILLRDGQTFLGLVLLSSLPNNNVHT